MCIHQQPCPWPWDVKSKDMWPQLPAHRHAQESKPKEFHLFKSSSMAPCKTCSWVQGLYREHTEPIVVFFVLGGAKNSSMSRPSTATDEGEAPGGPVTAWCPWLINNPYLYLTINLFETKYSCGSIFFSFFLIGRPNNWGTNHTGTIHQSI